MFKLIFKKALKIPKIESLNNFLFVGPHPDDIEIGCGALVAKLTSLGKKVSFLVATDGRVGSIIDGIDENKLVEIRKQEAINSAKILGVLDVTFLNYHDGDDYDIKDMQASITKKIIELKPDMVFFPDPYNHSEFHSDHLNVAKATYNSVMNCNWEKINKRFNIEGKFDCKNIALYYTSKPNQIVRVKKYFNKKVEALRCHVSQFDEQGFNMLTKYYKLSGARLGFKKLTSFAEGYRVLTTTHMHCFVEGDLYF